MHDDTPAHIFRSEREHLTLTFQDCWIVWEGPTPWTARSSNLNPLDFWLSRTTSPFQFRHPVGEIKLNAAFCYELQTSGKFRPQQMPTSLMYRKATDHYRRLIMRSATLSTDRLFSVDEIDHSETVLGEMRPRVRHDIRCTFGSRRGNSRKGPQQGNQPKRIIIVIRKVKVCHGSLYAVMWLADEPREFNLPTLPQRCITYVPKKLPSKYGVNSEEYLPIRTVTPVVAGM
ncbi:hypothetical protein ANN_05225 [Periplaneta americana]|uniref:Uncharacterized protein n=1 Tax=Periplaneta americana TaxID=6978 RepID=A0ABQ8TCL8_PERAM|nr:hypothetical protein ANN_05225 [Periplaneta americana]